MLSIFAHIFTWSIFNLQVLTRRCIEIFKQRQTCQESCLLAAFFEKASILPSFSISHKPYIQLKLLDFTVPGAIIAACSASADCGFQIAVEPDCPLSFFCLKSGYLM
jgi:hypothetical protein